MIDYIVDAVKTNTYEIPFIKFGKGNKTLVVIPGMSFLPLSDTPQGFVNAFERFSNDYVVYLFDRKKNMSDEYFIENMAIDTLSAIKILNLNNIYLYGASQGGMIAQLIAIHYPKLVKKLVLASTSFYNNIQSSEIFNQMILFCDEYDSDKLINYSINKMYSIEFLNKYRDFILNTYNHLSREQIYQYRIQCNAYHRIYLFDDLNKISAKTLIIASMKDQIFNYENSLLMTSKLNCDCVIYDEYSHCVYDEASDFIDRLYNFFNK